MAYTGDDHAHLTPYMFVICSDTTVTLYTHVYTFIQPQRKAPRKRISPYIFELIKQIDNVSTIVSTLYVDHIPSSIVQTHTKQLQVRVDLVGCLSFRFFLTDLRVLYIHFFLCNSISLKEVEV